jgi:NADPH-dependent curcumin reductase CurA
MPTNTQVLLDHRPTDKVSPANFRFIETPVPTPGPGQVLVRHTFLSLDPYMRGRLSDAKSYAKPQEVGAVMGGGTVGIVEASNNPRFKAGDAVVGMGGWQRYSLSDGRDLNVVDAKSIPSPARPRGPRLVEIICQLRFSIHRRSSDDCLDSPDPFISSVAAAVAGPLTA